MDMRKRNDIRGNVLAVASRGETVNDARPRDTSYGRNRLVQCHERIAMKRRRISGDSLKYPRRTTGRR